MANQEILTDDYIAELLAKDARESSIKYSSLGLEAFTKSNTPANKPKPNTRFLRNIIKDTDSHNAALLAKEAAESRARLQSLSGNGRSEEKAGRIGGGDIRRRQLGDIAAILGGRPSKRKRIERPKKSGNESRRVNPSSEDEEPTKEDEEDGTRHRSRRDEDNHDISRAKSHRSNGGEVHGGDRSSHRSNRRRDGGLSEDREKNNPQRRRRDDSGDRSKRSKHKRRRSRSRTPQERRIKGSRLHHRSPKPKRSVSLEEENESSHSHRRNSLSGRSRDSKDARRKAFEEPIPDYESDPLDEIIGPRPPPIPVVTTRGRGAISFGSGIDDRFSASYDPTVDVQLDPDEENDWDQALEALRDRQKWKQQGADRLRAAGFTEDEVTKWEKGGEKREEDVKWAKRGEGREWDRGKVVDEDGIVTTESSWGRLKDEA